MVNNINKNNSELVSFGGFVLPPVIPGPEVDDLCDRLDKFYHEYPMPHKGIKASDLVKGAFYAARSECKTNPDWMGQSASSLRDVLYPLFSKEVGSENIFKLFKKYATEIKNPNAKDDFTKTFLSLDTLYKTLNNLSHHGTKLRGMTEEQYLNYSERDFDKLTFEFVVILRKTLSLQQIFVHKIIDLILTRKRKTKSLKGDVALVINNSLDSKRYFFSRANEKWFCWLRDNKFLDSIKEKAENSNQYSYTLPELEYLTRTSVVKPQLITDFILTAPISKDTFNPEVIDRFIWIIEEMPAEQIKVLIPKIKKENWIHLMRKFNKSGYQFHKIIEKLVEAKEDSALLDVAEVMLSVCAKDSRKKSYEVDSMFALDHISEVGIFDVLANINELETEAALRLAVNKLSKIIKQSGKDEDKIFEYEGYYSLLDSNIFTLSINRGHTFGREDFENLIALIKRLVERTIGTSCDEPDKANELLKLILDLPDSRLTWRIKLFALAQCPEAFQDKIKKALDRVFNVGERYFEIEGGAEYHELLLRSFNILGDAYQRRYVENVFNYFTNKLGDEDKEKWRKRDGGKILCLIGAQLTGDELKDAVRKFDVDPKKTECKPEPISSGIKSGSVTPQPPEDITKMTIAEIINRLKTDYDPEKLNKKFKHDDIFKPRGVEGLGEALKEDIKNRLPDYFNSLDLFFDGLNIAPHYIYSLLRGIEEMLRDKKILSHDQIDKIILMFIKICSYGKESQFESVKTEGMWIADWIAVHRNMADVVLQLYRDKEIINYIMSEKRTDLLKIILYLLLVKDSPNADENKNKETDLHTVAINSVRGRAFEAFVMFIQNDCKELKGDTKEIFEQVLKDDSLAVRFIIGRYIGSFFFRDKEFIHGLWSEIFPKDDQNKKDIYLATWEGYLSNTLYSALFDELSDYYSHAIKLKSGEYPDRKYHKSLDEALAIHVALAFAYLNLKIGDPLFDLFWSEGNSKRYHEFVSFIGRSCLTRSKAGDEWLKQNNVSKKKLIEFWDWALDNVSDREALSGFGYWISYEAEVIEDKIVADRMAKTMMKSKGLIDWDYGLMKRLTSLANIDHVNTLLIIKHYLLDELGNLNPDRKGWGLHTEDVKQALEIIYKKGGSGEKSQIEELISNLIDKGSSTFWVLKEIIK